MTASKEEICINALQEICMKKFREDEYSLNGPKENAVCLEKISDEWSVYEKEKNSRNDSCLYDNIVEACLDLLRRLCTTVDYKELKNAFFDKIIISKSA